MAGKANFLAGDFYNYRFYLGVGAERFRRLRCECGGVKDRRGGRQ